MRISRAEGVVKELESKPVVGVDAEVARGAASEVGVVGAERACESRETGGRACQVSGFVVLSV